MPQPYKRTSSATRYKINTNSLKQDAIMFVILSMQFFSILANVEEPYVCADCVFHKRNTKKSQISLMSSVCSVCVVLHGLRFGLNRCGLSPVFLIILKSHSSHKITHTMIFRNPHLLFSTSFSSFIPSFQVILFSFQNCCLIDPYIILLIQRFQTQ